MFVREYVNKRHKSLQHGARYKCCLIESARRVDCPKQSAQYSLTGNGRTKMASYFWREIFYVPFPGTPGKIPGNSGSTELRKEFGTTLTMMHSVS